MIMEQWIIVLTMRGAVNVFRLVDEVPNVKVRRFASIIYNAANMDFRSVVKDRYGIFDPELHPISTNEQICRAIDIMLENPETVSVIGKILGKTEEKKDA